VTDKKQATMRIQWVRSGIGFSYRQKEMVRSLGLRRLQQVVERPDTPQVRGLVANIPHLVRIVPVAATTASLGMPEFTILPPEPQAEVKPRRKKAEAAEAVAVAAEPAAKASAARPGPEKKKPAAAAKAKKAAKAATTEKKKPAKAESKKVDKAVSRAKTVKARKK
jgi:large subunit ribosomal protein L30